MDPFFLDKNGKKVVVGDLIKYSSPLNGKNGEGQVRGYGIRFIFIVGNNFPLLATEIELIASQSNQTPATNGGAINNHKCPTCSRNCTLGDNQCWWCGNPV